MKENRKTVKVSKGHPRPSLQGCGKFNAMSKIPKQHIALEAVPPHYPGDFDELTSQPPSSRLIHSWIGSEDAFNWELLFMAESRIWHKIRKTATKGRATQGRHGSPRVPLGPREVPGAFHAIPA